jgi:poly(A) polymerase
LRVMAATGILSELLPGALDLLRLKRLVEIDADNDYSGDAILRLAGLLPDNADAARTASDALKLSNADRLRLEQALDGEILPDALSAKQARALLYRMGAPTFRDKVLLHWASHLKGGGAWRMLLEMADNWQRPRFALTGRDVMAAGVPQGPDVGRILAQVEDWWVNEDFAGDEVALRERLKALIDQDRQ